MLQVATFAVGVVAVFIGIRALVKGEVSLYATKKLRNSSARIAGLATLICGLGILVFAWLGFSWLLDGGATSTSTTQRLPGTTATVGAGLDESHKERGHPCPHEREARTKSRAALALCGQGCPRST